MFPKDKKRQFLIGMRSAIPIVIAYIPMGIAYAISARSAGLKILETIMMSVSVFTGAGQMLAAQMLSQNALILAIIFATFIINLRYVIMSTCVVNGLKGSPLYQKMFATFGVTDEAFAVFTMRSDDNRSMTYWMGLMLTTYAAWITGAVIGAFASDVLPEVLKFSFDIAMHAMFISLIVPGIKGSFRLALTVVITAGINCVLSLFLHGENACWAVIISMLVGALIGVFLVEDEDEVSSKEDKIDDTVCAENLQNTQGGAV